MKHADRATLVANATPLPAGANRSQILSTVANMIDMIGPSKFRSLHNVEGSLDALRKTPHAGTAMEPIAASLQALGRDVGPTVGDVMDAASLNQAEVNRLACHCHNGDEISGHQAAANLRELAAKG